MNNTLQQEWWKHPLPDYLGPHQSNYVLNEAEVEAFATALASLSTVLNSEGRHVSGALRAMRTQRVPAMQDHPTPVTLVDMMQFVMTIGKTSKYLLEVMTAAARKRGEVAEAEMRG